ncbi:MAG: L,D-transpeptidase [Acidimicrobiales bacterium]
MNPRSARLLAGMVIAGALVAGCSSSAQAPTPNHHPATEPTTTASGVPTKTLIATFGDPTPGSPAPGAPSDLTVPATWYGYPSALPVIAEHAGFLEVRLAQRPNGSTTWVPAFAVSISTTPYALVLNLSTEHLAVYDAGKEILDFPAGIGTNSDPTVTGQFFVAMKVPAPSAGYGPFVLVTSAHSDSITDWEMSGDAIIAIHGPIDTYDDALIGTTGARISHGCVRLHDSDLSQLAVIPPGTPLDISA